MIRDDFLDELLRVGIDLAKEKYISLGGNEKIGRRTQARPLDRGRSSPENFFAGFGC